MTIEQVEYHRNGICGEGFHAVLFRCEKEGERLLGIVFGEPGQCAVISLDRIAEYGVAFGHNSWRGDTFEAELRQAIEGGANAPPRPSQRADGNGSVRAEADGGSENIAALFAAAPRLIESLQGLVNTLEGAWSERQITAPRFVQCQLGEEVKRAKKAIRLAKGE